MKKLLLFTTATCLLFGCFGDDEKESKEKQWPEGMVMDAAVLRYANLQGEAKEKASDDLLFLPPGNPSVVVQKETGFYVRLVLNNKILASVCTDGGLWKEADMLDNEHPYKLYGKYKNNMYAYDAGNTEIPKTQKHGGYNLFLIKRTGDVDTVYYGPMTISPDSIKLYCSDIYHGPKLKPRYQ